MRSVFFIVCNYNAERYGALSESMRRLQLVKRKSAENGIRCNVVVFDNASSDSSAGVLFDYRKNGTVDHLTLSSRNCGKSFAMDTAVISARHVMKASDDDVLVSLDSDIAICNEDFCLDAVRTFDDKRVAETCMIGYEYYSDYGLAKKDDEYHKLVDGLHIDRTVSAKVGGITYRPLREFQGKLAGGLLTMTFGDFEAVGGYPLSDGGRSSRSIYGNDDGNIEYSLWTRFGRSKMFLFDERPQIVHPKEQDDCYTKWKKQNFSDMESVVGKNGFFNA